MTRLRKNVRQALTVARRDFVATVATPTFLIFLLAPLFMIGFGAIGGLGATMVDQSTASHLRIVALAPPEQAQALSAADARLRDLFPKSNDDRPGELMVMAPQDDLEKQARDLFDTSDAEVTAVLYGPLEQPIVLYTAKTSARYLAQVAETALRDMRLGTDAPSVSATLEPVTRTEATMSGKGQIAFLGAFGLFLLTLMLSSQAIGTMAEERSNKVIEILAAAVPLESVFFGKLLGSFGVSLLFLGFWATLGINAVAFAPPEVARVFSDMGVAVGFPAYPLLFFAYFMLSFMLMSALLLGIGAQASTQRELQMMSLPITIGNMAMLGLASAAVSDPDGSIAMIAAIIPFSSPLAMIARAAQSPEIWPHLIALAWQLLWVVVIISLAARWFRRGVLQSAGPKRKRKRAAQANAPAS
ncbi:ABC transporter permease [Stakelama tenebrarum]|uniref:ABC transporter permease n=1 Tax=Stakelama tenebrarum TaxID=2711215 RepID=A0A6G6Y8J6_9SPHN|nr:ABC transporter permease [Sphingosinithalassobacter tenebrarum]QIG81171.1 ABC transporter permease [Sphingosinithalassobacter tenebrarum]